MSAQPYTPKEIAEERAADLYEGSNKRLWATWDAREAELERLKLENNQIRWGAKLMAEKRRGPDVTDADEKAACLPLVAKLTTDEIALVTCYMTRQGDEIERLRDELAAKDSLIAKLTERGPAQGYVERAEAKIAERDALLREAEAELHAMSRRLGYDGRSGIADKIERVLGGEAKS